MKTSDRIKYARKKAGFTQKQLGERLGVSAAMIAQYENGSRNPKLETLDKIAHELGVLSTDLLTFDLLADYTEPKTNGLHRYFDKLNETGQGKVIDYAADLVESGKYKAD